MVIDVDEESRQLHAALERGELTREQYSDAFDRLYLRVPPSFLRGLDFRKDRRSLGEFALEIYDATRREKLLIDQWNERNGYGLKIQKLGTEDSGLVLFDPQHVSSRADYVVAIGDQIYGIEIKFCPTLAKLTYKVKDLRSYIDEGAYVLTIMHPKGVLASESMRWFLMEPALMERLLSTIEIKQHWEMGRKPSIQILAKDFDKFIKVNPW